MRSNIKAKKSTKGLSNRQISTLLYEIVVVDDNIILPVEICCHRGDNKNFYRKNK